MGRKSLRSTLDANDSRSRSRYQLTRLVVAFAPSLISTTPSTIALPADSDASAPKATSWSAHGARAAIGPPLRPSVAKSKKLVPNSIIFADKDLQLGPRMRRHWLRELEGKFSAGTDSWALQKPFRAGLPLLRASRRCVALDFLKTSSEVLVLWSTALRAICSRLRPETREPAARLLLFGPAFGIGQCVASRREFWPARPRSSRGNAFLHGAEPLWGAELQELAAEEAQARDDLLRDLASGAFHFPPCYHQGRNWYARNAQESSCTRQERGGLALQDPGSRYD
eukprot:scaffold3969_cov224-Pinguiococcus_pyrenoidosus.AAC.1